MNINKKFAMIGVGVLFLVSVGAGCVKPSNDNTQQPISSSSSLAVDDSYQEYTWKEQGITFKYPTGLIIKEPYSGTVSFFSASTSPEDMINALEILGSNTQLFFLKNTTVDAWVQRFNGKDLRSQAVEKIGVHTFTKIQLYNGLTGNIDIFYLLPFKNGVLIYKTGEYGPGDTTLTLSSLEF